MSAVQEVDFSEDDGLNARAMLKEAPVASQGWKTVAMSEQEYENHINAVINHIFKSARLVAGAMCLSKDPAIIERLGNALSELENASLAAKLITT